MGRSSTLLLGALLLLPAIDAGAFTPPHIVGVINQTDS
ncbi:uncharacterized protein METZ01_LOCUS187393, partial [marine metagenome]